MGDLDERCRVVEGGRTSSWTTSTSGDCSVRSCSHPDTSSCLREWIQTIPGRNTSSIERHKEWKERKLTRRREGRKGKVGWFELLVVLADGNWLEESEKKILWREGMKEWLGGLRLRISSFGVDEVEERSGSKEGKRGRSA